MHFLGVIFYLEVAFPPLPEQEGVCGETAMKKENRYKHFLQNKVLCSN